jgi:hypothetical protein
MALSKPCPDTPNTQNLVRKICRGLGIPEIG